MCDHKNIFYEFYARPVCSDCQTPLIEHERGMKFCDHNAAQLVRVQPDPIKQDGVVNLAQYRFILYCPNCGNFIDYIARDADQADDNDISC